MKMKFLDIIFIVVLLISSLILIFLPYGKGSKSLILLHFDKEIILPFDDGIIDLNKFINANMLIEVKNKKVKVVSSDCRDKICVNYGEISSCGESIVCLPNKVAIKIVCDGEIYENK